MPFPLIPLALSGVSALSGALGNKSRKQTQAQTTTTALSPGASSLNDLILGIVKNRLGSSADLSGHRAEGLKTINDTFGNVGTALTADLTARGLSDSPAAAAPLSRLAVGRAGSMSQFLNSLPQLQRQMQAEDLGFAQSQFALQPRTTTTTGVGAQQGQPLAGGIADLGSMLGFLMGSGAFGHKKPGVGLPNSYLGF